MFFYFALHLRRDFTKTIWYNASTILEKYQKFVKNFTKFFMLTDNILDLIGNTPLMHLKGEKVFAKAEFFNPGGSIKDRVALAMLEAAKRDGKLKSDSIIVEPSSGNTGIGLALVGRLMGYPVRIVMPSGMSEERKKLIRRSVRN